jgi:hypothetical protein
MTASFIKVKFTFFTKCWRQGGEAAGHLTPNDHWIWAKRALFFPMPVINMLISNAFAVMPRQVWKQEA